MTSLLPTDKLSLKRLESAIKRISVSGILLVGVDTLNLSNEFENYLKDTHSLKLLDIEIEILSTIAYDDTIDKKEFFLVNIFNKQNQQDMINHLQFQRDFIPEKNIKIVVILSNEMLEYLKTNAGDLFSTVKFSYSFTDHSFNFKLEKKDDKLNKAIKEYENYLKLDIQHNDILFKLTWNIAVYSEEISDFILSLKYYKIALKYVNSKIYKANTLCEIGNLYFNLSNNYLALKYQNKSLKIQKQIKNKIGIANSYTNIGNIYYSLGKINVSMNYNKDALKLFREMKSQQGVASSLSNIGSLYQDLGKLEMALKYHNDSLKIYKDIGYKAGIASLLNNIGTLYQNLGKLEIALKYHNDSLEIKKEIGNKLGIANSLNNIGSIYQLLGKFELALKYFNDSLKIKETIGDKSGVLDILDNIDAIDTELNEVENKDEDSNKFKDFEPELRYKNDLLKMAKENKYVPVEAKVLKDIANLHKVQSNIKEAKKNYLLSRQLYEAMGLTKKVEEINKELDSLSISI